MGVEGERVFMDLLLFPTYHRQKALPLYGIGDCNSRRVAKRRVDVKVLRKRIDARGCK